MGISVLLTPLLVFENRDSLTIGFCIVVTALVLGMTVHSWRQDQIARHNFWKEKEHQLKAQNYDKIIHQIEMPICTIDFNASYETLEVLNCNMLFQQEMGLEEKRENLGQIFKQIYVLDKFPTRKQEEVFWEHRRSQITGSWQNSLYGLLQLKLNPNSEELFRNSNFVYEANTFKQQTRFRGIRIDQHNQEQFFDFKVVTLQADVFDESKKTCVLYFENSQKKDGELVRRQFEDSKLMLNKTCSKILQLNLQKHGNKVQKIQRKISCLLFNLKTQYLLNVQQFQYSGVLTEELRLVRDSLEKAMKILKQKMSKEGILQELKRRRFYEKPSEARQRKAGAARQRSARALRRAH